MAVRKRSLRRSKLVVKGGEWHALVAASASDADIVHLELEAGFPPEMRPQALENTRRALDELDWSNKEAWVRFRPIDNPQTRKELACILGGRPHLVYCAKVKSARDIVILDHAVTQCEEQLGIQSGSTEIGAVIERVEALANVKAIANASPRMGAIMFGANDMALDFGYRRTGIVGIDHETLYIRSRMVLAGRLANIDILDAAYMRDDLEGGEADAAFSARMGFTGKTAISARHIAGIHRAFLPTEKELVWAREIVAAASNPDPDKRRFDNELVGAADIARANMLVGRASR